MRRYFLVILIILLAGATYFADFFISKQRSFDENLRLKQENENLKAQVQRSDIRYQISDNNFIIAKVFSTYPFNVKSMITVNAGQNQGIKKMMVATYGEDILLGYVVNVFTNHSALKTIFDPDFQLSVRIGEAQIDGLFQGGNESKLTLIEKSRPIKTGDIVYSASKEFPYGLKVGEISEIKESAAGVFKEAILKMPFNINELREVNIIMK